MANISESSSSTVVIVGFAEALSAPEVVWSLVDAGFKVVAFSRKGRRAALRQSRHVTVHEITAPENDFTAAATDLTSLLRASSERRRVLFPLDDAAISLSGELDPSTKFSLAGARGSDATFALNKWMQVQAAKKAGFMVPESILATTRDDLRNCVLRLPLILRPAQAVSVLEGKLRKGRNWICSDQDELSRAIASWEPMGPLLVQPFIQGVGEGIFGLATDMGVIAWSAHRRVRMMNPHGSGSSACASQAVPEQIRLAAERLIELTRWRGLFMIELLRDQSGNYWFVEFNGRPWGSMALSRHQGLEYPAWAVDQALTPGKPIDVPATDGRPIVCRNLGRELMHLLFVLRGPKSKALKQWPAFWPTAFELARVRTGDSLYNWRRDDLKVFCSDCWNTLRDNLWKSNVRATEG